MSRTTKPRSQSKAVVVETIPDQRLCGICGASLYGERIGTGATFFLGHGWSHYRCGVAA